MQAVPSRANENQGNEGNCLLCSMCELPPRKSSDGNLLKLKSCSVCKSAWYHDVHCQRAHFKQHKKVCGKLPNEAQILQEGMTEGNNEIYRVDVKEGRGRCMIATVSINKGTVIGNFCPLVPPVLLESFRNVRCAVCAGRLPPQPFKFCETPPIPQYPIFFCSLVCRSKGKGFLEEEQALVADLVDKIPKVRILPTAIILFRLLKGVVEQDLLGDDATLKINVRHEIDELQSHEFICDEDHISALRITARHMMEAKLEWMGVTHQPKDSTNAYLTLILSKLKTNAFSICDGENIAIGIGLYGDAAVINHSCNPNALQTFQFGEAGKYPSLQVTACSSIPANHEICISYIDNCCPRERRQETLKRDYRFHCTCSYCVDDEREGRLVGLECFQDGCSGLALRQDGVLTCMRCGCTNFMEDCGNPYESDVISDFDEVLSIPNQDLVDLKGQYITIQSICSPTSWYSTEAGENLLQGLLTAIGGCESESRRLGLCTAALELVDELLRTQGNEDWRILKTNMLRYKGAKLRLFIQPDPIRALQDLQTCFAVFRHYYSASHEIVVGIKSSLDQVYS
jgi:SET domain